MEDIEVKIRAALSGLDPAKAEDWTEQGLPNVARVRDLAGDQSILRADISKAAPDFNRETAGHGAQEPAASGETAAEAPVKAVEKPKDAPDPEPAPAPDAKADTEDHAEEESDDPETVTVREDFSARGLLMAMLLRLPAPLRVMADSAMLDGLMEYVGKFETFEERQVAVEMLRSLAESGQQELIPSGQYRDVIDKAMDAVHGRGRGIASSDDRHGSIEAAARFRKLTGYSSPKSQRPDGDVVPTRTRPASEPVPVDEAGSTEQNAARNRLYNR